MRTREEEHEEHTRQSARLLREAVLLATRRRKYDSALTRAKIHEEFTRKNPGKSPYSWQINVAEAILLGLDCTVIAGTGAGKTMPFIMPLFVQPQRVVLVISPLNALEEDQAERFRGMGLKALAVNGETYNDKMHVWGKDFRPEYAKLGTLRSFVPVQVPFLVTSATLPSPILSEVRHNVHLEKEYTYHVHLGTDRPNIAWFTRTMKGGKKDLESLGSLLLAENMTVLDVPQTLVFFDEINVAIEALKHLRKRSSRVSHPYIQVYHSRRSPRAKKKLLRRFRNENIRILLSTEAAGMVIQFMVPESLAIWMQRAGRAGRNRETNARAILLVQPTVFQEVKSARKKDEEDESLKYRKDVDVGLRRWIETKGCRRDVAAEYLDDGCRRNGKSHPQRQNQRLTLTDITSQLPQTCAVTIVSVWKTSGAIERIPNRRGTHLQDARSLLTEWRRSTWMKTYAKQPWGMQVLLSDKVLNNIALHAKSTTLDGLKSEGWNDVFVSQHGDELLCKLNAFDLEWRLNHEEAKKRRGEAKKQETERKRAERVAQKKAEQEAARALRKTAPRQPRPSRSKHIIAESENIPPPLSSPDLHTPSCPTLFQLTPLHTLPMGGLHTWVLSVSTQYNDTNCATDFYGAWKLFGAFDGSIIL
ncbi:hypothetical protein EYR40_011102 [Pleurotus pulmonarius]|nr:hypothetical protein EYR40_011102 [Pleurotus pulmonarius]